MDQVEDLTISSIIPTRGRSGEIFSCVDSLLRQSRRPDQIVIVDQNEKPDLRPQLEIRLEGSGVELIHIWNSDISGLAQARNVGFEASSGDVALFLDDDVELEEQYIQSIVDLYKHSASSRIGGAGGWITNGSTEQSWFSRYFLRGFFRDDRDRFRAEPSTHFFTNALSGCNMSFVRDAYSENRADESLERYSMGEDWDISTRISRTYQLVLTSRAKLRHNESPAGRMSNAERWAMYVAHMHYFFRNRRRRLDRVALVDWLSLVWFDVGLILYALNHIRLRQFDVGRSVLTELLRQAPLVYTSKVHDQLKRHYSH